MPADFIAKNQPPADAAETDHSLIEDRVTKICFRSGLDIEVQWQHQTENLQLETHAVRGKEGCDGGFTHAISQFKAIIVKTGDLPDMFTNEITIRQITFAYADSDAVDEKGTRLRPDCQVSISIERPIRGFEKPMKIGLPKGSYLGDSMKALNRICEAALDYAKGLRAEAMQIGMFDEAVETRQAA